MVSINTAGTMLAIYIGIIFVVTVLFLIFKNWGIIWILSPIWIGIMLLIAAFFGKCLHLIITVSYKRKKFFEHRKREKIDSFLNRK